MKIFNWMRMRFRDDKGRSVENVTQDDETDDVVNNDHNDNYNKCLLNDHQINDQWIGGYLLSIGTFGFDPAKHGYNPNQQPKECPNHYNVLEKDIEVMKKEKEIDENQEFCDGELRQGKQEESMNRRPVVAIAPPLVDDQTAALIKITKMDGGDDDDDDEDDDNEITMIMEKKERVTLADLFNAESAGMLTEKPPSPPLPLYQLLNMEAKAVELMSKVEATTGIATHPLAGKEFKKKKLSSKSVKQISQPIQKLVKKMLKRKIYPDVEARIKANNVSVQQTPGVTSEVGA